MRNCAGLNNLFSRDRKILYIVLSIVLVSVLTLTVVYAALSTTLNINGNAEVTAASWDIYLDNVQLNSNSVTANVPTITDKTTATFSTTLSKPGDYYMFTIDVVNNGSIDAMINSITKTPELTETQKKYLNYIVEYQNGESITTKQLVEKQSFVRLKVKIEFRKDITALDLPSQAETLNLSFKVNYIQSNDSSENVTIDNNGKLIKVVSGDYNTIGSEICIGEECFYVISSDEESVTMLAKYNLYVGGEFDPDTSTWTVYGEEATGIQDSTMIGYGIAPRKGTTLFSNDSQKGEKYSDYTGSIVEKYVNSYRSYLEGIGASIKVSRLISKLELETLGCPTSGGICSTQYPWVYSTSYWSGTSSTSTYVWRIGSDGHLGGDCSNENNGFFGVRPVITIPV